MHQLAIADVGVTSKLNEREAEINGVEIVEISQT